MHNFLAHQPPWTPQKCTPARKGSSNSSIWAAGAPRHPKGTTNQAMTQAGRQAGNKAARQLGS